MKIFFLISLALLPLFSCKEQSPSMVQLPEKIIFDTDMGSDCDDVGALALLHTYADMGKAEILACIYSSGKIPYGAGVVHAINVYYGRGNIPIGACHGNEVGDPIDKMNAETLARDTATFKHRIIYNSDAEEQTKLNRRILLEQEDHSITYVTIGHTKGLYDLLVSKPDDISPLSGHDLVKQKIKRWVALGALGAYNEEMHFKKDWNFFFNGTAPYTKHLVENFPVPVFFVDGGSKTMTGKSLKYTPPGNIVRIAYEEWLYNVEKKTLDDQRPSWDLVTVFYAVEGLGAYLEDKGKGWLEFEVEKGSRWHSGKSHLDQTFILQKDGVDEQFADYLNEMIVQGPNL